MNDSSATNPTQGPATTTLNTDQLAKHLAGELILPGDADYETARVPWNKVFGRHPKMIVRCRTTADVVHTIRFARDNNLPISVRSGGHSPSGLCVVDDGVVIDLSLMTDLTTDPESKTARVGAGLTWGAVTQQVNAHGFAIPAGDTATVGVGGLTLAGGIGWLVRKYGLTIDHLLCAEIVTADGQVLTASETEHPDLFWAIRGGGGNFGVATSFEFSLTPLNMVLAGMLAFPATPDILPAYFKIASEAPEELTTISMLMLGPPMPMLPAEYHGKPVFFVLICYAGNPQDGEQAVAPLRALSPPIVQMVQPMPYSAIYRLSEEGEASRPASVRSMFLDGIDAETTASLLQHLSKPSSPMVMLQFRVLGGAMARVPSDATAFAHRDKKYLVTIINAWMNPASTQAELDNHRAWTEAVWRTLQSHANGVYVSFLGDEDESAIQQAYPPDTYNRLAAIKRRYDPTNIFKGNRNIPPAAES